MLLRGAIAPLLAMALFACSGASSTELFTGTSDADVVATEPPPEDDPEPAPPRDLSNVDAEPDVAPDAGEAPRCRSDEECTTGICNWKTDRCASAAPIGAPCKRDLECLEGVCNWKLETCLAPAESGTFCRRNKECASRACDDTTETCE